MSFPSLRRFVNSYSCLLYISPFHASLCEYCSYTSCLPRIITHVTCITSLQPALLYLSFFYNFFACAASSNVAQKMTQTCAIFCQQCMKLCSSMYEVISVYPKKSCSHSILVSFQLFRGCVQTVPVQRSLFLKRNSNLALILLVRRMRICYLCARS